MILVEKVTKLEKNQRITINYSLDSIPKEFHENWKDLKRDDKIYLIGFVDKSGLVEHEFTLANIIQQEDGHGQTYSGTAEDLDSLVDYSDLIGETRKTTAELITLKEVKFDSIFLMIRLWDNYENSSELIKECFNDFETVKYLTNLHWMYDVFMGFGDSSGVLNVNYENGKKEFNTFDLFVDFKHLKDNLQHSKNESIKELLKQEKLSSSLV